MRICGADRTACVNGSVRNWLGHTRRTLLARLQGALRRASRRAAAGRRRDLRIASEAATMDAVSSAPAAEILEMLVGSHREFLAYVQRRVHDRALAEEIVQDALVRSLEHAGEIRESAVGWFYRVLRNAIIDHARRRAASDRQLVAVAAELAAVHEEPELRDTVCRCVGRLASALKPEYAEALQRIDLEDTPVKEYAEQAGISASNAGVRVF